MNHDPKYRILTCSGEDFKALLGLTPPPLVGLSGLRQPFRQLEGLELLVKELGAKSILLEEHYVDRDHLHDHGAYHAGSLQTETSRCRRMHFFRVEEADLATRLGDLQATAASHTSAEFHKACADFSREWYLGFSVIRPLVGSCVGRTQLAAPVGPTSKSKTLGADRIAVATRAYTAHVAGIPLTVHSLPFQQQDLAVSRCATVAVWTAVHQARSSEGGVSPSPAEITRFAARYSLDHGRAMPSEGLSVAQMCQAIDAAQLAPVVVRARDLDVLKRTLHAAVLSKLAPILVIQGDQGHAVVVAGMALRPEPSVTPPGVTAGADQIVNWLIHDDRFGPYRHATISTAAEKLHGTKLRLEIDGDATTWALTHAIFPVHSKIRIAFLQLCLIQTQVEAAIRGILHDAWPELDETLSLRAQARIVRSTHYLEQLLSEGGVTPKEVWSLANHAHFPRYVGVLGFAMGEAGRLDVLVDTTSPSTDVKLVAAVPRGVKPGIESLVAENLVSDDALSSGFALVEEA